MEDLTGKKFGRLTVVAIHDPTGGGHWRCLCSCGVTKVALGYSLRGGRVNSCGCLRREMGAAKNLIHGKTRTPTNIVWQAMRARCNNKRHKHYSNYGGRGITVCSRWGSFENFLEDMGERPSMDHSIERVDRDLGYFKENCRWATRVEQNRNSSQNVLITHNGESKCLAEWCEVFGLDYMKSYYRIVRRGLTLTEVLANGNFHKKEGK